jgi:hypothetical protein
LLPFSEEVEKQFRQLAREIHEMGGEASLFSVMALDAEDEQRILHIIIEARNSEYATVTKVCVRFLAKAMLVIETQGWNDQVHAEFAEVLEKVHVLFRSAKRHDLLGTLTATKRADAAEALSTCEQVFRLLLDQDYLRARRILDLHADLLPPDNESNGTAAGPLSSPGSNEQLERTTVQPEKQASPTPDLPI